MKLSAWIHSNNGRAVARANCLAGSAKERKKVETHIASIPRLRGIAQERLDKARKALASAEQMLANVERVQATFINSATFRAEHLEREAARYEPLPLPREHVAPLSWVLHSCKLGTRPSATEAFLKGVHTSQRDLDAALDVALALKWVTYSKGVYAVPEDSPLPELLESA